MALYGFLGPENHWFTEELMLKGSSITGTVQEKLGHVYLNQRPDIFLFTAFSAVPLADTVRGFYNGMHEPVPELGFVRADTSVSHGHFRHDIQARAAARRKTEILRLSASVVKKNVCIVDQYHHTGLTTQYARKIIEACDVESVAVVEGQWYEGADRADVNLRDMTSKYHDFMYAIGQKAAKLYTAQNVR